MFYKYAKLNTTTNEKLYWEKSNTPQQATGYGLACSFDPKGRGSLHSVSVGAERVPLAHSAPRGIRQISARARLLGSLLAKIKLFWFFSSFCFV